jgi:hypothetical protein
MTTMRFGAIGARLPRTFGFIAAVIFGPKGPTLKFKSDHRSFKGMERGQYPKSGTGPFRIAKAIPEKAFE